MSTTSTHALETGRGRPPSLTPAASPLLQRKCACGGAPGADGLCAACREKVLSRSRDANGASGLVDVPPVVHDVLRSPGQPLDSAARAFFEPRFGGHDFSRVRVHADARAADSARAVNAHAYTVGRNVVFGAGQYAPNTTPGKSLLAHELTHVLQQRGTAQTSSALQVSDVAALPSSVSRWEAEAESNAARVAETNGALDGAPSSAAPTLLRQPATATPPPVAAPVAPTQAQQGIINSARLAAFARCQSVYQILAGIGPPGPGGDRPDLNEIRQREARTTVRRLFGEDLNMDQVTEIVGAMRSRLGPGVPVQVGAASDPDCGSRAGYVRGFRPPIVLCPAFFNSSAEEQARTLVHEAAHLSGIGEVAGESYCGVYDCQSSCGGFDVADSWSHLVHCLSGRTPDTPITITAPSGGGTPKPKP